MYIFVYMYFYVYIHMHMYKFQYSHNGWHKSDWTASWVHAGTNQVAPSPILVVGKGEGRFPRKIYA